MDLKIYNGRSYFYQWDSDQKFIVDDASVNELHFTNNNQEDASVVSCYEQEGIKLCDIPNSYLEKNGILTVYAFTYENGNYTKNTFRFNVIERPKPNDYVVEEEDINRWGELDNKINLTKDELENEIETSLANAKTYTNEKSLEEVNNLKDDLTSGKIYVGRATMSTCDGSGFNIQDNYALKNEVEKKTNETLTNAKAYTDEVCNTKAQKNHGHIINEVNGLQTALDEKAYKTHSHMDLSTRITEVEQGKANVYHVHSEYYGKTDVNYLLNNKADKNHTHDDKYYPKEVIDEKLSKVDANVSEEDIANAVEDYLAENPIEDELFEVNLWTNNYSGDGSVPYKCNKTYDEIYDAIRNKKRIIASDNNGNYYSLSYRGYSNGHSYILFNNVDRQRTDWYIVQDDGTVTRDRVYLQESNPKEFNGTSIVRKITEVEEDIDELETELIEKINKVDSKERLIPWEHVLDRPFYDTRTTELTFDGNVNDPRVWMGLAVCLTDYVPTNSSELVGAKVTIAFFDNANYTYDVTITSSMIRESNEGFKVNTPFKRPSGSDYSIDAIEVIKEDLYYDGVLLIKKGIYGYCREDYGFYVSKFSMNGKEFGELKKLDEKYLPNMVSSWNDLEDKPFYDGKTTIIENDCYTCNGEDMGLQTIAFPFVQKRGNGKLYVSWNGAIYSYSNLIEFKYDEITTWYIFGNVGAMNSMLGTSYPITNEPFIGAYVEFEDRELPNIVFAPLDGSIIAWIEVWREDSKTLDTKYLPQSLRFGEVTSNTITFDGIKDFKEYIDYGNDIYYVKASDYVPTKEEVLGTVGYFVDMYGELLMSATTTEDMIQDVAPFGFASMMTYNGTPLPVVIANNNDASGYSQGVYFILFEGMGYVSKVEFKNNISNVITPIDSKFIPTFGNVKNYLIPQDTKTLVFDEEGNFAISELPSLDVVDTTKPIFIDLNGTIYENDLMEVEVGTYLFGNVDLWFEIGDNGMPFLGVIEDDGKTTQIALLLIYETESVSVSAWQNKDNNLLISSPNGKVFKLVVDDEGMLYTVDGNGNSYKTVNGNEVLF